MSLFKNIRIELLVLLIISLNVFISFNLDLGLYNYFKDFNKSLNSVYLKEFFVDITRLGSSSWYFAISVIGFGVVYLNNRLGFIKLKKQKKLSNFFISSFYYILFIASGAFHLSKPSDMLPELQGRLPIRVELDSLSKKDFKLILTETQNSLIKQYQGLLGTEKVDLKFE